MTLNNPRPSADIENAEFENDATAKRVLLIGKTTTSTYVPIKLNADGSLA
jgi:hypothetical protein